MRLLVGPTCAGKSTLLKTWKADAASEGLELTATFGYQLGGDAKIPSGPQDVVHFNLLRGWKPGSKRRTVSVDADPLLPRLIEAADDITVVCAPLPELVRRAGGREHVEDRADGSTPTPYPSEKWIPVLQSGRLPQVYEHLALALDGSGKPYRYLCTNSAAHANLTEVSRWDFPAMGGPGSDALCDNAHPARALPDGGSNYQGDYRDGGEGSARSATMAAALRMPLQGKRVLDIGCAEGAAALSAARMGARVTGIEPWGKRYDQARAIAQALGADVDLRNVYLGDFAEPDRSYDVVMALNVIHHAPDPFEFLDQAVRLTRGQLVLEYPSLNDKRFRSTIDFDGELPDNVPLIGVSTVAQDQTFVFSPASLTRYLIDTTHAFGAYETLPSPKPNRWITVFSDRQQGAGQLRSSEAARLKQGSSANRASASVRGGVRRGRSVAGRVVRKAQRTLRSGD